MAPPHLQPVALIAQWGEQGRPIVAAFDLSAACAAAGVPVADRFSIPDVARVLRVPDAAVRGWVKAGRLACIAYSRRLRFVPAEALVAFAAEAHRPAR